MELTLESIVEELSRRQSTGGYLSRFFNEPNTRELYPKAWEFFDAGKRFKNRLFTAGNQVGKSTGAGAELTMHLTGDYHPLWQGRTFDHPVKVWIVGERFDLLQQTVQPLLLGQVGAFGTGFIPKDALDLETIVEARRSGTPIRSFRVKHRSGGFSTVNIKSGEQGREAFQAATLDIVWFDEEIPFPVYNECMVRLMVRKGISLYTFTPLKGTTETIETMMVNGQFIEGDIGNGTYVVRCSMYDVPHHTKEGIEDLIARTPPYLRDARIHGIPSLGSGAIYPVPESEYLVSPFPIPPHWKRLYGMDVGTKTAAIWLAQNPDSHQWFAYWEYYKEREEPSIHAAGIMLPGKWIPGAIDPASRGRSQVDGKQLMQMYKDLGLTLTPANNAVETGLYTVWEMLSTDQLKVFDTLTGLRQEMRTYARDEKGNVIKKNDHRCFVGETPIWTDRGLVPIKDLVGTTGRLLSTTGLENYQDVRLIEKNAQVVEVIFPTGSVVCTPDHKFLTTSGWVEAQDLSGYNVVCPNTKEYPWTPSSSAQQSSASTTSTTTSTAGTTPTSGQTSVACTSGCGKMLTALSRKATTSITSTRTRLTTALRTLSAYLLPSTWLSTLAPALGQSRHVTLLPNGTAAMREELGTAPSILERKHPESSSSASSAVRTSSLPTVVQGCATRSVGSAEQQVCLAVRPIDAPADVFCLTVPTTSALTVGPGVIAHNCDAFRYAIMTRDIATSEKRINTSPLSNQYVVPIRM